MVRIGLNIVTLKEEGLYPEKEGSGEKVIIVYELIGPGKKRFEWFKTINIELSRDNEWNEG